VYFFLHYTLPPFLNRSTSHADTAVWKTLSYEVGTGIERLFCDDFSRNGLTKRYQELFLVAKLLCPQ